VLQALVDGVADADVYVRINAVEALGLKAATPVTVAALSAALADPRTRSASTPRCRWRGSAPAPRPRCRRSPRCSRR